MPPSKDEPLRFSDVAGSRIVVEEVPATYQQELELRLSPDEQAYINLALAWRIRGPFELDAARRAIQSIVNRHESLRASLARSSTGAVQHVRSSLAIQPLCVDVAAEVGVHRWRMISRLLKQWLTEPFDLCAPLTYRSLLARLGEGEHLLLLVVAHTVWDEPSTEAFGTEFISLYRAFTQDQPSQPAAVSLQLGDLAAWQREQRADAARVYWHRQLRASPGALLPTAPVGVRFEARTRPLTLVSSSLVSRMDEIAKNVAATRAMFLTAGTAIGLSATRCAPSFVIATAYSNRDLPGTAAILGCLVDHTPLKVTVDDERRVSELVADIRDLTREASRHHLPSGSLEPLLPYGCDVWVNYVAQEARNREDVGATAIESVGLPTSWSTFPVIQPWWRTDLDVNFVADARGVRGFLTYNASAISDTLAIRLANVIALTLRLGALRPDASVGHVSDVVRRVEGAGDGGGTCVPYSWTRGDDAGLWRRGTSSVSASEVPGLASPL